MTFNTPQTFSTFPFKRKWAWIRWFLCLVEGHVENLGSHRYELGKGRTTLIEFSGASVYSFLLPHQNSKRGGFLKVSCNVEFETI